MSNKRQKRVIRCVVWLLTGLLVLAFCPGPVEGNWSWQPSWVRGTCGCDSYRFERYQNGAVFKLNSNHPPPLNFGGYEKIGLGRYRASFNWPGMGGGGFQVSGFAALLFRLGGESG